MCIFHIVHFWPFTWALVFVGAVHSCNGMSSLILVAFPGSVKKCLLSVGHS